MTNKFMSMAVKFAGLTLRFVIMTAVLHLTTVDGAKEQDICQIL